LRQRGQDHPRIGAVRAEVKIAVDEDGFVFGLKNPDHSLIRHPCMSDRPTQYFFPRTTLVVCFSVTAC
jgi:hypothetical protein